MNTIYRITINISIFFLFPFCANAQTCDWVKVGVEDGLWDAVYVAGVNNDNAANTYVVGWDDIGPLTFGTVSIEDSNYIFVVKYDSSGNVLWAKNYRNHINSLIPEQTTIDQNNNVYISGETSGDTVWFNDVMVTNAGGGGVFFILKLDSSGNILWARTAAAAGYAEGLSANTPGYLYACFNFYWGTATFDTTTITGAVDWYNVAIVKYDTAGNLQWARMGIDTAESMGCSSDLDGNLFVTGALYTNDTISDSLSDYGTGMFLTKFDSAGNQLWQCSSHEQATTGISVKCHQANEIYVSGGFEVPRMSINSISIVNHDTLSASGDIFLAKFSEDGSLSWLKDIGGPGDDDVRDITVSKSEEIFLVGDICPADSSTCDIFIKEFDTSGNLMWSDNLVDSEANGDEHLSYDNIENLYIAAPHYNPFTINGFSIPDTPGMFLAQFNKFSTGTPIIKKTGKDCILYPNPAYNSINISCTYPINQITITNAIGQTLYSSKYDVSSTSINIINYPPGLYFACINNSKVIKWVKE